MADILEKAIVGEPVMVEIRGTMHRLSYPLHNVIVYQQQTSESLFDREAWKRIDLKQYPERWLACLWAGLHELQPDGKTWKAPYTVDQLGALVDFANAAAISEQMVKALIAHFPAPEKKTQEEPDLPPPDFQASANSGPDADPATPLVATSS